MKEEPEAQRVKELSRHFTAKPGQGGHTAWGKSEGLIMSPHLGLQVDAVSRMKIKKKARFRS